MKQAHKILRSRVSLTNYDDTCDRVQSWIAKQASCYVIAANVHVIMTAYWNRSFQQVVDRAAIVTPDGMPLVFGLRLLGISDQSRVYGPDLMIALCDRAAQYQIPVYLYGGTQTMLDKLSANLVEQFPALPLVGTHSPPFRSLSSDEEIADINRIQQSGAQLVFVGLGCPKQELWMAKQQDRLSAVMVGVGAAFAFHSGEVSQAPRWIMALGCEWLYRFSQEPQRLWKRYLINNPTFLVLFSGQLFWSYLKQWQTAFRKQS